MMLLAGVWVIGLLAGRPAAEDSVRPRAVAKLFFGQSGKQWCVYRDEAVWKAAMDPTQTAGVVELSGDVVEQIHITTHHQFGAELWTIYDTYVLSHGKELFTLERRYDLGNRRLEGTDKWLLRPRFLAGRVGRSVISPEPEARPNAQVDPGGILQTTQVYSPAWTPQYGRLEELPIWSLIRTKKLRARLREKACRVDSPPRATVARPD